MTSQAQVLQDLESVLLTTESRHPTLTAEMAIRTILLALSSVVWADAMCWAGLRRKRDVRAPHHACPCRSFTVPRRRVGISG